MPASPKPASALDHVQGGFVAEWAEAVRNRIGLRRMCRLVQVTVAVALMVPAGELRAARRRAAPIAFARQIAMYLAHVTLGLSYTEIGYAFRRDRTTVAHACRLVEERRDGPAFDAALLLLEDMIGRQLRERAAQDRGARR
jgi:hypothetical protein